jgi:hypothetical protein
MAIHQADLAGSRRDRERVNPAAMAGYLQGEADLSDGLDLSPELVDSLRRQAHALMTAGRWQRCIDVTLALVAMGSVHPADPLMLAHCYRALGMPEAADQCQAHGDRMMQAMGLELPPELDEEVQR